MKSQLTQALQLDASETLSVSLHSLIGRVSLLLRRGALGLIRNCNTIEKKSSKNQKTTCKTVKTNTFSGGGTATCKLPRDHHNIQIGLSSICLDNICI